ncbi:MAG: hypothetical protein P4L53_06405 [Candidatus Obscuribacterales bacterium]|nr:hypothetical protein [Candidatus Obscuribacterales bacterium]
MSSKLSIGNHFLAISFKQFQTLVTEFKELCETSFGTECTLQICAMCQLKLYITRLPYEDILSYIRNENEQNTFFKSDDLLTVTSDTFDAAVYIDAIVSPTNKSAAPDSAFGGIEFKGKRPNHATYYVQPSDANLVQALKERHPFKVFGDGYKHHGTPY